MSKVNEIEYHIYVIREGVEYAEAYAVSAPKLRMSSDAGIKKTMTAQLILPSDINVFHDTLVPRIVINGKEYPLGEYYIGTYTEIENERGLKYWEVEAYDGGFIPSRYRTETIYHISSGSLYTDVIQGLLIECGIENMLVEASAAFFVTDREDWEIGTDYLTIINELLAEINYGSLWFDNNGFARIERQKTISPSQIDHKYISGKYSVLGVYRERETDIFDKYNVFIAYVDNADNSGIMIATAINDDDKSSLSVQNRGRFQAPPERLNNIASQEELQAYVDNWKQQSMTGIEMLKINTGLDAAHGVLDTVQCEENLYQETEWAITLDAETLVEHTLVREVYL